MQVKKIAFVNTNGQGVSLDFKRIQDRLAQEEQYQFSYYVQSGSKRNPWVQKGMEIGRQAFCEQADAVIVNDHSLPGADGMPAQQKRILLATPSEYWFAQSLDQAGQGSGKKKEFSTVTHLACTSPFIQNLLNERYQLRPDAVWAETNSPFVGELKQEDERRRLRDQLKQDYPGIQNRKILLVLTFKETNRDMTDEATMLSLDVHRLFEQWGDDWFLLTNSKNLIRNLDRSDLTDEDCQRIGLVQQKMLIRDMVKAADFLVTNHGTHACEAAAAGRPVLALQYKNRAFEQYMQANYSELCLTSIQELIDAKTASPAREAGYRRFCAEHTYADGQPAVDCIVRWLE